MLFINDSTKNSELFLIDQPGWIFISRKNHPTATTVHNHHCPHGQTSLSIIKTTPKLSFGQIHLTSLTSLFNQNEPKYFSRIYMIRISLKPKMDKMDIFLLQLLRIRIKRSSKST